MKIQTINKLNSNIKSISKDLLATGNYKPEHLLVDNLTGGFSDLETGLPDLHVPILSLITKYMEPIKDLNNGEYKSAFIKGCVRTTEALTVLPFKLTWSIIGAGIGLLKQACGFNTDSSGLIGGMKSYNRKWKNARSNMEQILINPYSFIKNHSDSKLDEIIEADNNACAIKQRKREIYNKHRKKLILLDMNRRYDNMSNALKCAELKINTLLSTAPEIEPISQQDIEFIYQECDNKLSSDRVKEIKKQQAILQKSYETNMAQFHKMLKNGSFANTEQGIIIKKITDIIQNYYEQSIGTNTQNIEKIAKIITTHENIANKLKQSGFNKIAGYNDIKQKLTTSFIKPIKKLNAGKKVEIPNLILFYGPQGCGKTLFSNALAEETKCNVIELDLTRNENENIEKLKIAIDKAKEIYKKDNIYSIIRIDELDVLLYNKTKQLPHFLDLDTISKNNFCTIVATTNYPDYINKNIIPQNGFKPIYIAPANNKDIQEILKFYFADINNTKSNLIDCKEIADYIQFNARSNSYSNARIAMLSQKALIKYGTDTTENNIKNYFDEYQPDIEQKIVDQYRKD